MANANTTATFARPEIGVDGEGRELRLTLEADAGRNPSPQTVGTRFSFFLISNDFSTPYQVLASVGSSSRVQRGVRVDRSDQLTFTNTREAELAFPPVGAVSTDWYGAGNPGFTIDGDTGAVRVANPAIGVLTCSYQASADRHELAGVSEPGTVVIVALQGDQTASLTVDFVAPDEEDTGPGVWDICGSRKTDIENQPYRDGAGVINVYGRPPTGAESDVEAHDPGARPYIDPMNRETDQRIRAEAVTFDRGVGHLQFPVADEGNGAPEAMYDGRRATLNCKRRSTRVTCAEFLDNPDVYTKVTIQVSYTTHYQRWIVPVPFDYPSEAFEVRFKDSSGDCPEMSVGLTLEPTESGLARDITIRVSDNNSGDPVSGAQIYIDGTPKGATNGDGILVTRATPGQHPIKITHSEYIDSDEDSLSNDTITVSEE